MLRVGLTGGIGSGKSTVSARLAELGAVILDADKAARAVVEPGTPGLAAIAATFGAGVLAPDGSLDRPKLAGIVFADKAALGKLNAITHPLIHEHIQAAEEAAIPAGGDDLVLVHDVALLAEWGRGKGVRPGHRRRRPNRNAGRAANPARGMPEDQARARMAAQATRDQRLAVADIVIDNSGTRADLDRQVTEVWAELGPAPSSPPQRRAAYGLGAHVPTRSAPAAPPSCRWARAGVELLADALPRRPEYRAAGQRRCAGLTSSSAAGELLAERGQGLVRGERAGRRAGLGRPGGPPAVRGARTRRW